MVSKGFRSSVDIIPESELVLNAQGKVYHLNLAPHEIADTIILVGDPHRVRKVSQYFDRIEHEAEHREFLTQTGLFRGKKISVLGTGIGTDNIDIVLNELDALVNVDLVNRRVKEKPRSLQLVRIGTSGALQEDIPVDSFVLSEYGLGLDAVLNFYDFEYNEQEAKLLRAFTDQTKWKELGLHLPYIAQGGTELYSKLSSDHTISGITATANGFYGPQGRSVRLKNKVNDLNDTLRTFLEDGHRVTNFEMETSALFGLAGMMGHQAATVCAIIANRYKKEFSPDYHKTIDELIRYTLNKLSHED